MHACAHMHTYVCDIYLMECEYRHKDTLVMYSVAIYIATCHGANDSYKTFTVCSILSKCRENFHGFALDYILSHGFAI